MAGPKLAATEAVAKFVVEEITRNGKATSVKLSNVLQKSKALKVVDKLQVKTINLGIRKCVRFVLQILDLDLFEPTPAWFVNTQDFHLDKIVGVYIDLLIRKKIFPVTGCSK